LSLWHATGTEKPLRFPPVKLFRPFPPEEKQVKMQKPVVSCVHCPAAIFFTKGAKVKSYIFITQANFSKIISFKGTIRNIFKTGQQIIQYLRTQSSCHIFI
jgi:hypothetical protein